MNACYKYARKCLNMAKLVQHIELQGGQKVR